MRCIVVRFLSLKEAKWVTTIVYCVLHKTPFHHWKLHVRNMTKSRIVITSLSIYADYSRWDRSHCLFPVSRNFVVNTLLFLRPWKPSVATKRSAPKLSVWTIKLQANEKNNSRKCSMVKTKNNQNGKEIVAAKVIISSMSFKVDDIWYLYYNLQFSGPHSQHSGINWVWQDCRAYKSCTMRFSKENTNIRG